jgi:uncharacterized protein (UPF0332 family)
LERAPKLLAQGFTDEVGRAPYLAGFHAAQVFQFEKLGRSPKTHSGVQSQFAKLAKAEPSMDLELRAFLGRAYNLKAIADYETGHAHTSRMPGRRRRPAWRGGFVRPWSG